LLHSGEHARALTVARDDAAHYAGRELWISELLHRIELAEVAARCGEVEEGRAALERSRELAERTECRMLVPQIHEAGAALAAALRDEAQRRAELHEAHRLYVELGATGHAERLARELGA